MRIDRMLAIVVMLLNRKNVTARELADRFEVSLRTIYRDIDAINQAGVPVVSSQGAGGGYSMVENYRLNHQYLSLDNTKAILTALKGFNTTLQDREVELTMDKIRALVPAEEVRELDRRLDQFVVDYLPWGFNSKMQARIQEINRAIRDSNQLTISYLNLKGEASTRDIEPMTLLFKGYNWYLFAYCLAKKDGRIFRLSRIKDLKTLGKRFVHRDLTFTDFTRQEDAVKHQVDLELKFDPIVRPRVEESFYAEQITESADGYLTVKVSFVEDNWVYSLILGYGEFVEVVKPHHIRQIILDSAKKIQAKYQT